jgi:hypothetical protein
MGVSKNRLEPRAAQYLQLLVEFGHLDRREVEQVVLAACESWPSEAPVPLRSVQRVAAVMLFAEDRPEPGKSDILTADWPLLFY